MVDTEVISQAPVRFLIAGMGDALATWFEARSCHRTNSNNELGTLASLSGLTLAELCYNTLLEFGYTAKIAAENQLITPALDKIIEANTLLSGIGFESVGVAAAHSIHNGLSAIKETRQYYHGEKVAFGVLTSFFLNDAPPIEIDTVYSFCREIGLPTTLAEIGIKEINRDDLRRAAEKTLSPEESIHKEPVRLTTEKVVNAMLMADAYGREFGGFI